PSMRWPANTSPGWKSGTRGYEVRSATAIDRVRIRSGGRSTPLPILALLPTCRAAPGQGGVRALDAPAPAHSRAGRGNGRPSPGATTVSPGDRLREEEPALAERDAGPTAAAAAGARRRGV